MLMPLKKFASICLVSLVLFLSPANTIAQKSDHAAGDLIVMLHQGADVHELISQFAEFNNQVSGLTVIQQLSKRLNIWLLHFDASSVNESKLLSALTTNELVSLAQFNHFIETRNIPNDERFGEQWNMLNIGQTGGTSGADVRATDAWDITTGGLTASGDTIVVAIDDDGFDLLHADLDFWKNKLEIPGNFIDDDENGYVDDYDGWNSQTNSGTITSLSSGHGTHVAGIAAARGNNSIGVTGVNWNVKVLPVQGNSGLESVAVAGYAYILEMRAKYNETNGEEGAFIVSVNSSWGVNNGLPANFPIWCAMYDSMGFQGILNAAATSNSSNVNVDVQGDMPTACTSDYLVTVTNTDKNDIRGGAFGATTIDLGAPGTSVLSTTPGSLYGTKTGTSMSSPHVAGAIALLCALPCEALSNDLKNDAAATMLRIKGFILDAVDPAVSLDGLTVSGGRLNVKQAMNNATAYYNCNVGINEATNLPGTLKVYPNPASTAIMISLENSLQENAVVNIMNLVGQEVMNKKVTMKGTNSLLIDISQLPAGMYMLRLTSESGLIGHEKIVVE
jgi:serine protease